MPRTATVIDARASRFRSRALIGAIAVLAPVALMLWASEAHRDATAQAVSEEKRPNVLVFVTDDQRRRGTMRAMPKTRRILGQHGTRYPNALVTTPQCCPSRASIFSGRYPHNHLVTSNDAAANLGHHETWQRYLHRAGYHTALFGKYLNGFGERRAIPNFDESSLEGRHHIPAPRYDRANAVRTIDLIRRADPAEPWAAVLAFKAPHYPFTVAPRYRRTPVGPFRASPAVRERDFSDKNPGLRRAQQEPRTSPTKTRAAQLRMLRLTDDQIARVWQAVKRAGAAHDTLVLFLSDNGYYWGEHGLAGKFLPYLDSLRVPMYARWDGHLPAMDDRLVLNIDLAPTILDAAGIAPGYTMDGRSLLDRGWDRRWVLLEGAATSRFSRWPTWNHGYYDGRRHYFEWANGFAELYDLRRDPYELENRLTEGGTASRQRAQRRARSLSARIEAVRACRGRTCP